MAEQKGLKGNVPDSIKHMTEDDDDIVTLISEDGEEVDFVEIAGIAYRGNFYAVLQPVELLEGMTDEEALVFKVTKGENGEDNFEIEIDETIINAVYEEYLKLLADLPK
ncbi:MAG: DUF1292 domain-containing protein [Christensenellales bacterium]